MAKNEKGWIFASRQGNEFVPGEVISDLETFYAGLEYGDVIRGEYQLWEYPKGRIFDIVSDRELEDDNDYATPYGHKGIVWLPRLVQIGENKDKVAQAYASLSN